MVVIEPDTATVKLNGSVLTSGTDYNVDHKPFSEAWYYDYNSGTGSTYTKLADGGDTADSDEYLGDAATNYTFSDNFDEPSFLEFLHLFKNSRVRIVFELLIHLIPVSWSLKKL